MSRRFACLALALSAALFGCAPKSVESALPAPPMELPAGPEAARYALLISNANSPFWNAVDAGVKAAGTELGIDARLARNDGSVEGQIRLLKEALANKDKIRGVGVSVIRPDAEGVLEAMKELRDAGVPLITIDSDCAPEHRAAFVGTNNLEAGKALGRKAAELKPEGGQVCVFVGDPSAQNAIDRLTGFKDGAGDKFTVLEVYQDNTEPAKARSNVESALVAHADANVMLGLWSYNGPAIADVVSSAGKLDSVLCLTFDAEPNLLPMLEQGQVAAALVQRPYEIGKQGIEMIQALATDDAALKARLLPKGGNSVDTGMVVVTPATFAEFKKYLDEKGLQSS